MRFLGNFLTKRIGVWIFCILCLTVAADLASAQQLTAQIKGTVTDASGAAVPGATVTATNVQTGVSASVPSQNDGSFQFLQLAVGTYKVTITKSGFNTFTEQNIPLVLNQIYNLPVTLQVGAVSVAVEVQGNAAQVETTNTQLGTVVQGQQILDMPLNGRNWTSLQQLAPGVMASSDRFGTYATNGSQSQQNSFLINGADAIDLPLNTPLIIPSPDAIGEFNLITSTINPEYGRNSGAILNAVIKSGTNQFHGDAFEFYRDTFLNARNLFQPSGPVFHQNQYGGTFGGPIWKDHTFFFLSYQGLQNRAPESGGQTSVFSAAQRNGIFDSINSGASSPFPLVGEDGTVYPAGTPYSTLFPTGHVPTADFNPISAKLLATYVPQANSPGGIYTFNPVVVNSQKQGIARIDHTFGQKDGLWVSLFFQNSPSSETLPFTGGTLPGFGDQSARSYKQFSADWTHTFTPTTLNELRLSYLRFNYATVEPQTVMLPSSAGFDITPQNAAAAGLPLMSVTGYFSLGFSNNGPQPRIDETYEIADNFSKIVGNHTLKFGYDGKRYNVNNPFFADNNGVYSFGASGQYSTGDPAADFMLGIPDQFTQESGGYIVARTYEHYFYAQDSWKVNNHLTLNFGAGYQIDTPLVNLHFNKLDLNCFIPGEQSTVFPTAPVGLDFPGDPGCTSSGYHEHYNHIGPRFGFAYSPGSSSNPTTVIRGGFGIYFNRTEEELELQNLGAVPFSETSYGAGGVAGGSPSFANPYVDIATGATVANPFPFTPPTKGAAVDFSPLEPFDLNVESPDLTSPYAMNFNLNVQKQLPGAMIMQLGYVGALGRHLELTYEGNPISPAGTAACAADPGCVADRVNQPVDYPDHTLYASQGATGDIFASAGTQATLGVSSYNSFQAELTKRLSHGLSFIASYTFSHSIDDASGYENSYARAVDPYDFALNKGDSNYDARQRLVISYDYELPHVSRFWNNAFTRGVFDGWHVAGITTLQSGFPILVTDPTYRSLQCSGWDYYGCWDAPNSLGTPATYDARNSTLVNSVKGGHASNNYYYFNPNAFALEPIGTLGNEGRDNFHGPGINNTDLMLSKRVYLTSSETRFFELRIEGYNVFNHTQFALPSGNINSANFGRTLSATSGRVIQLGAKFYF